MRKVNLKNGISMVHLMLIVAVLIFSTLPANVKATTPTISITPERSIFYTDTTPVYSTFVVNVTLNDVVDLFSWQINVTFNPALLQCVDVFTPADSPFKFTQFFGKSIDNDRGFVMTGYSHLATDEPPTTSGSGILATITFNITGAPTKPGESLSCGIEFSKPYGKTTWLKTVTESGPVTITDVNVQDGYYEYTWPMPPPYLEAKPSIYNASSLYENITIEVFVGNVSELCEIVGFQFVLRFNATLLEPIELLPGGFMEQFVDDGEDILYTGAHDYLNNPELPTGYNAWAVFVQILPNATPAGGVWIPPFPDGEGTLVTLKFRAIYETISPAEAWTDLTFTRLSADAGKYIKGYAINQYGEKIPFEQLINGSYVFETFSPEIVEVKQDPSSDNVLENQPVKVSANVTDYGTGVKNVTLIYTTDNWTTSNPLPMEFNDTTGYWEATIPGKPLDTYVQYKVEAYDWAGNFVVDDNAGNYYTYTVIPEFTAFTILILMLATLSAVILIKNKKYLKLRS